MKDIRAGDTVTVTPSNPDIDGQPFTGTIVDTFEFEVWYVRTPDGELTGPWEDTEVNPL